MKEEVIQDAAKLFDEVLTVQISENPKELFTDHLRIKEVLRKISAEQDKFSPNKDRVGKLPGFVEWCKKNNIKIDNVDIIKNEKGLSLVAKDDLPKESFAVEVPRSAILTTDSNKINKGLRELFLTDQLVQRVENCPLVLLLAHEILDPNSQWKPYLDILPAEVGGPLRMTDEEISNLKPSPAYVLSLQFFRYIARHYVYFLLMIYAKESGKHLQKAGNDAIKKTLFTTKNFSFELYSWCTAIVASRVNRIPNLVQVGSKVTTSPALIPAMDLANFEFVGDVNIAQSEVYYATPQKKIQLLLRQEIKKGDEVLIPIGTKANHDCLIHSGFVPAEENPVNIYELRLGFPKNTDKWKVLYAQRLGVLNPNEMATTFIIHLSTFYSHPLEYVAFWNFAKLFVAVDHTDFNTKDNVVKARDYILKRFSLYLDGYKGLPPKEPQNGSMTMKYIWRMKNAEKKILEAMVNYFQQPIEKIVESNGPVYNKPTKEPEQESEISEVAAAKIS